MQTLDYYATTGDRPQTCDHESSSGVTVDGVPMWECDECGHQRPKTPKQIIFLSNPMGA